MFTNSPRLIVWLIAIIPGMAMVIGACLMAWRKSIILRWWPQAWGEVVSAEVVVGTGSEGDATYTPRVVFRYQINGRERAQAWNQGWSTGNKAGNEEYIAKFSPNSRHEIRYDPDDPARIECDVGFTARFFAPALILGAVGLFFMLLGAQIVAFLPKTGG
jgi:hypothetical protein